MSDELRPIGNEEAIRDLAEGRDSAAESEAGRLWQETRPVEEIPKPDIDKAWRTVADLTGIAPRPMARVWILRTAVAASVVLIAVVLFQMSVPAETAAVAAAGQQTEIELTDGSTVLLNSESRLLWTGDLSDGPRSVRLEGEAFFDVASNGQPFEVTAGGFAVQVLGTRFSVRSREGKGHVAVEEGLVAVESGTQRIELGAGNAAEAFADTLIRLDREALDAMTAWTQGGFGFVRTPFSEVVAELARRSDRSIRLESASLGARTVSGSFAASPVEAILEAFCLTLECEVQSSPQEIRVRDN